MIILTNSLIALPLLIVICALDSFMFLATLRLFLGQFNAVRRSVAFIHLQALVDIVPGRITKWLELWNGEQLPKWVVWPLMFVVIVVFRSVFAAVALSTVRG